MNKLQIVDDFIYKLLNSGATDVSIWATANLPLHLPKLTLTWYQLTVVGLGEG